MKIDETALPVAVQHIPIRRSRRLLLLRTTLVSLLYYVCIIANSFSDALIVSVPLRQSMLILPRITTTSITAVTAVTATTTTTTTTTTELRATTSNGNDNNNKNKKNQKAVIAGVYVRPSVAIEKGSGFFVPGLEGPKVRFAIGIVLLAGTVINHWLVGLAGRTPSVENDSSFLSFSEGMAIIYSILLLFQSAIEYVKENLPPSSSSSSLDKKKKKFIDTPSSNNNDHDDVSSAVLNQKWSDENENGIDNGYKTKVQWAAASYLNMTPTTQIMLLNTNTNRSNNDGGGGNVLFRLGEGRKAGTTTTNNSDNDSNNSAAGVEAALNELRQSKGGRISLPLTHPSVQALLLKDGGSNDNNDTELLRIRTVILQRITDDSCWLVVSDQLLAGYTSGDLKWLGQLAKYVVVPVPVPTL
mmetsp:Transcript_11275/g.12769  ORF Transcript_11275/g.12769 Transcript_11275/m.12769 type:complete len:414 (+) Transcript_11275:72-1313(+)